jgi:hypothetical protein
MLGVRETMHRRTHVRDQSSKMRVRLRQTRRGWQSAELNMSDESEARRSAYSNREDDTMSRDAVSDMHTNDRVLRRLGSVCIAVLGIQCPNAGGSSTIQGKGSSP